MGGGAAHSPNMHLEKSPVQVFGKMPVFPVACWALGLMAFLQLVIAGMALASRFEDSRQVRVVEKEVVRSVVVRVPEAAPKAEAPVVSRPPAPPEETAPVVPPAPLAVPRIADPRSERMVAEAREARVAGDMGRAIVKLEEALAQSPDDASVHYELGLVHEQMGVYDTAAAHYEKVFQMGTTGAGALYEMAGAKLRDGFELPEAMLGRMSLGRVRIFNNPNDEQGQKIVLTIPVHKSPVDEIDVSEIAVSVEFFNRTSRGEIIPLEDNSWVSEQWVTLPFDWAGGEESLRMTYLIPPQDRQTEHLFGARSYYGQVVSLMYKGEVLDIQAWPRDLAARISRAPARPPADGLLPEFMDSLPPDFDPELPLLPALPTHE
jgi:TPR repeat